MFTVCFICSIWLFALKVQVRLELCTNNTMVVVHVAMFEGF